ncbi:MAG: HAMP domain-containing sensor histidine kinase [Pseudomonadota bacterium]
MALEVELGVVIVCAAVVIGFSLCVAMCSRRAAEDASANLLALALASFLLAATGFICAEALPFWLTASMAVAGAVGGICIGFSAIMTALGSADYRRTLSVFAALAIGLQTLLAFSSETVVPLLFSSAIVNCAAGAVLWAISWRRVHSLGGALPVFLAFPFFALSLVYGLRLVIYTSAPGDESHLAGTTLIAVTMAVAALSWAFGLIALRELQARAALAQARDRIEAASRAKSDFLRSLSHELRTPLNAVIGFAELMRRQTMGALPDQYRDAADHIHVAGRQLNDLIEDLLDLSVIEAGRLKLEESEVAAEEIVSAAITLVSPEAETNSIRFERRLKDGKRVVRVDRRRIVQAMVNLLSNAIKFAPEGSSVSVGCIETECGGLALFVADDGKGMSEDELTEAMTLFGRVGRPDEPRRGGIGVGLPLTRELAEAHGGALKIESAPQAGTFARLELPSDRVVGRQPRASAARASASVEPSRTQVT